MLHAFKPNVERHVLVAIPTIEFLDCS